MPTARNLDGTQVRFASGRRPAARPVGPAVKRKRPRHQPPLVHGWELGRPLAGEAAVEEMAQRRERLFAKIVTWHRAARVAKWALSRTLEYLGRETPPVAAVVSLHRLMEECDAEKWRVRALVGVGRLGESRCLERSGTRHMIQPTYPGLKEIPEMEQAVSPCTHECPEQNGTHGCPSQ